MARRIILPNDIDIVVASYGGVGTSFLLSFLKQYKVTNSQVDADGFKHSPLPLLSFNPNVKFIYVYGDPQMAAISLFRRDFQRRQSKKLRRWGNENTSPIPRGVTLEEYASLGVDRFHFENHFFNWYETYLTSIPILFIRYETIFDHVRELFDFVGIPESDIDRFPKKKERTSKSEEVSAETKQYLDGMYGSFAKKLGELNDLEIRQNKSRKMFSRKHFSKPYRKALLEEAFSASKRLVSKSNK